MICKRCQQGQDYVPIGEHFVSREMAIDAGMPDIEGSSMGIEWGWVTCGCCDGDYEFCIICTEEAVSDEI